MGAKDCERRCLLAFWDVFVGLKESTSPVEQHAQFQTSVCCRRRERFSSYVSIMNFNLSVMAPRSQIFETTFLRVNVLKNALNHFPFGRDFLPKMLFIDLHHHDAPLVYTRGPSPAKGRTVQISPFPT